MNKNRHIPSGLQDFFNQNDASKAIQVITSIAKNIILQSKVIGPKKNPN